MSVQISINEDQPNSCLDVTWKNGGHLARLLADMETKIFHVYCTRTGEDGKLNCVCLYTLTFLKAMLRRLFFRPRGRQ